VGLCVGLCVCVCIYVYISCKCMYACVCVYVCVYICVCRFILPSQRECVFILFLSLPSHIWHCINITLH